MESTPVLHANDTDHTPCHVFLQANAAQAAREADALEAAREAASDLAALPQHEEPYHAEREVHRDRPQHTDDNSQQAAPQVCVLSC